MKQNHQGIPWSGYLLLIGITLGWGMAWPFMKIAVSEFTPWAFRVLTLVIGGLGLLTIAGITGHSLRVRKEELVPLLVVSALGITGWHMGVAFGLSMMEASRATIIGFTMPLWATLLSKYLLKERITPKKWLGISLGFVGLVFLLYPSLDEISRSTTGALCMLAAAAGWAAGSVFIKYYKWNMPSSVLTGWQLLVGSIPVVIGALVFDPLAIPQGISQKAWLSVAAIIVWPIWYCHWAWTKLVRMLPAHIAANAVMPVPVLGVVSSSLVLGESISLLDWSALVFVLLALFLVVQPEKG
jgi:drug/metabolite transporter (DMT)-like permease